MSQTQLVFKTIKLDSYRNMLSKITIKSQIKKVNK